MKYKFIIVSIIILFIILLHRTEGFETLMEPVKLDDDYKNSRIALLDKLIKLTHDANIAFKQDSAIDKSMTEMYGILKTKQKLNEEDIKLFTRIEVTLGYYKQIFGYISDLMNDSSKEKDKLTDEQKKQYKFLANFYKSTIPPTTKESMWPCKGILCEKVIPAKAK